MPTNDPTAPRVVGGGDCDEHDYFDGICVGCGDVQRPAVLPEEGTTRPTPVIANDGSSLTMRGPQYLTSHWATSAASPEGGAPTEEDESLAEWCSEEAEREETYAAQQRAKQYQGGISPSGIEYAFRAASIHDRRAEKFKRLASRLTRSPRAAGSPSDTELLDRMVEGLTAKDGTPLPPLSGRDLLRSLHR